VVSREILTMPANRQSRTGAKRDPLFVVYRTAAGLIREQFSRAATGAAFLRAEFVERVENVPVFIQYGYQGRMVRCVS
jgi:hypothetical protein